MTLDSFYEDGWESDGADEPVGSCENCGCNLYEDDCGILCSQCNWWEDRATNADSKW